MPPDTALLHLPEDPLKDLVNDNFLQYASYVIRDRAIPQLEDGLKPVQRRILHALHEKDDGRNREPVIFPAKLPLLLMLGSEGIAVGLSTRVMPHNFNELLKAQIAILQDKRFKLLPDFPQGGLMDASEYNRGNGKIKLRARIEKRENSRLVIREIPFSTTTESVIASIEEAARKRRIRIRSINDFTAAQVEILITLSPGEDAEKAIIALYHFTQCEVTLHSNIVVIKGERPVQMDVDEIIRFNTDRLISLLKKELEIRQ